MSEISIPHQGETQHYAQSWALSVLVHGLAVGLAVIVLGDLKLTPKSEPFKWNVATVEPPPKPVAQPAESKPQAKAVTKSAEPQPVQRQTTVVQAAPPSPTPPTPVVQRQEPIQPVVEKKPEPEVKPEVKEVKQEIKEVKPEVPPPMPVVAKPVEPVESQVHHPTHAIHTQTAESHTPAVESVVEQAATPASAAPSHPAPSAPPTPMIASVAPGAPAAPQGHQESAKETSVVPTSSTIQEASANALPAPSGAGHAAKADYGWLAQTLWDRVANLKRYPHFARLRHLEGKVVVRAVINAEGHLARAEVIQSSGYSVLDEDALETLHKACPLHLAQPLGRAEVVVQVPINYRLH